MTRKSKKYQLLVSALLLCFLQVAGIDVYAQSTVTPARKDTTIIQREAPKARARRHRDPIIQDSVKKDSIQIIPAFSTPRYNSPALKREKARSVFLSGTRRNWNVSWKSSIR